MILKRNRKDKTHIYDTMFFIKEIYKADKFRIPYEIIVTTLQSIMGYILYLIVIKVVLNAAVEGREFEYILSMLSLFLCVEVVYIIIRSHFYEIFQPLSDNRIRLFFKRQIFQQSAAVGIEYYEKSDFYDMYIKTTSDIDSRISAVVQSLSNLVSGIATISTMSLIIFTIDPVLCLFILIPLITSLSIGKRQREVKYEFDMSIINAIRRRDYVRRCFFLKDYAKEIKLTNVNRILIRNFHEAIDEIMLSVKKNGLILGIFEYVILLSKDVVTYLGAIAYTGYQTIVFKNISLGDGFIVVDSILRVAETLQSIVDSYNSCSSHGLYIRNFRAFLNLPKSDNSSIGVKVEKMDTIELTNVNFKYHGSNEYVLRDFNLKINRHDKIAILGSNGSGKSTLIKLIMNLYSPTDGNISMNGLLYKCYDNDSFKKIFGSVFQDYAIFALDIKDNMLLDKQLDFSDEQLENIAKRMGIFNKIKSFENSFKTTLTKEFDEKGVVLSGGEYQKIALSRILCRENSVVILDEPSSALDPLSEAQMYKAMMDVCQNKTMIFVSHRMSSAILADKIYFLEKGQIVESGTHSELMLLRGRYYEMYKVQSRYYNQQDEKFEVTLNAI